MRTSSVLSNPRRAVMLLAALLLAGLWAGPLQAQSEARRRADPAGMSAREVLEIARASVVIVDAESPAGRRQGSGVVTRNQYAVAPDGTQKPDSSWVVTNAHVIKDATNLAIRWQGNPHPALLAYVDESIDLALLQVPQFAMPPLAYDPRRPVGTGQRVFAVGSPAGIETSITEGRVTGLRRINGIQAIQATIRLAPGHSGGALFDGQARLVGITASKAAELDGVGFAIAMAHVFDLERAFVRTGAVTARLEPLLGIAAQRSAGVNAAGAGPSTAPGPVPGVVAADVPVTGSAAPPGWGLPPGAAAAPSAAPVARGGMVFDCDLPSATGGRVPVRARVDMQGGMVNGDKATFTDNLVNWQPAAEPGTRYRLDLRAKSLLMQSDSTNTFASGNCRQSAAR